MTRHALGSLKPTASWTDLRGITHRRRGEQRVEGLSDPLQAAARKLLQSPGTDLLQVLPPDDPDLPWLEETAATLESIPAVELLECERVAGQGGHIAITAIVPLRTAEVRPRDTVCAGVAVMSRPYSGPLVEPRVYRAVCANGALLHTLSGERQALREAIGEAIRAALSPSVLQEAVAGYRDAARARIDDLLALVGRVNLATDVRELVDEYLRAGDPTGWGLINAATALARSAPSLARRLELEGDAARLLAVVLSQPPAHARSETREPAGSR